MHALTLLAHTKHVLRRCQTLRGLQHYFGRCSHGLLLPQLFNQLHRMRLEAARDGIISNQWHHGQVVHLGSVVCCCPAPDPFFEHETLFIPRLEHSVNDSKPSMLNNGGYCQQICFSPGRPRLLTSYRNEAESSTVQLDCSTHSGCNFS